MAQAALAEDNREEIEEKGFGEEIQIRLFDLGLGLMLNMTALLVGSS